MKAFFVALGSALPQILTALIVLAAIGVLAATGHVTSDNAFNVLLVIIGATGVAAGLILGNIDKPNTGLLVHGIIAIAILALAVVLSLRNVFTETQVLGVFSVLIGSSITGVATQSSTAGTALATAKGQSFSGVVKQVAPEPTGELVYTAPTPPEPVAPTAPLLAADPGTPAP